jgi:hypothetical protein
MEIYLLPHLINHLLSLEEKLKDNLLDGLLFGENLIRNSSLKKINLKRRKEPLIKSKVFLVSLKRKFKEDLICLLKKLRIRDKEYSLNLNRNLRPNRLLLNRLKNPKKNDKKLNYKFFYFL